jgi:inner membrane protein involved in colicin E2 resistance
VVAVVLFAMLAIMMYFTRKVDWYALGAQAGQSLAAKGFKPFAAKPDLRD